MQSYACTDGQMFSMQIKCLLHVPKISTDTWCWFQEKLIDSSFNCFLYGQMLFLECWAASQDLELNKNFKNHTAWGCHIAGPLEGTWNKPVIFYSYCTPG